MSTHNPERSLGSFGGIGWSPIPLSVLGLRGFWDLGSRTQVHNAGERGGGGGVATDHLIVCTIYRVNPKMIEVNPKP